MINIEELDRHLTGLKSVLDGYRQDALELEQKQKQLDAALEAHGATEQKLNFRLQEIQKKEVELKEREDYLDKQEELVKKREFGVREQEREKAEFASKQMTLDQRQASIDAKEEEQARQADDLSRREDDLKVGLEKVRQFEIEKQKQAEYANVLELREKRIKEREDYLSTREQLTRI